MPSLFLALGFPCHNCAGLLRSTPALKARVGRPSTRLDQRSPYGGGSLPPHRKHTRDKRLNTRPSPTPHFPSSRALLRGDPPFYSVITSSFARRSAFFEMENVYFEDDVGVSPQWLAVRVRLEGGLIPTYRDSFLCRPVSASEPGFMTNGHLPCAAICHLSSHRELFCAAI